MQLLYNKVFQSGWSISFFVTHAHARTHTHTHTYTISNFHHFTLLTNLASELLWQQDERAMPEKSHSHVSFSPQQKVLLQTNCVEVCCSVFFPADPQNFKRFCMRNDRTTYWQFFITLQFDFTPSTYLDPGALQVRPQYFLRLFKISRLQNTDIQWRHDAQVLFLDLYKGPDKSLARPGRKQLMFLSEWREFPSAPCLAGKKKPWWQLASRWCWNRARLWYASELVSFLVGLRTYQHRGNASE